MDQSRSPSFARSTGILQAVVCLLAFVAIALILGHLNVGGLAKNGDQLTLVTAVALVALVVVLRLQRAAQTIELDLLNHALLGRLDSQSAELRALERDLGAHGFLASHVTRQMNRPVINNYAYPAPANLSTSSGVGAVVLSDIAPALAKPPVKRAAAAAPPAKKAAAVVKKAPARVNPSRRTTDGKA